MAVGGWKYYGHITNPHSGTNAEVFVETQEWASQWVAGLAALSTGWSLHASPTQYRTTDCMWWALQHDPSGARLVFARTADSLTGGNAIDGSNEAYATTRVASNYEHTWWVAYVQPHLSATPLGVSPEAVGFLPAGSLKFFPMQSFSEKSASTYGPPHSYHIMVRGADAIVLLGINVDDDPAIDGVDIMGAVYDRLAHATHPTEPDTGVDALYGHIHFDDCVYNATFRAQFFDAAGNHRTTGNKVAAESLLSDDVCDREPWTWATPTVYVSSNDLDANGVVTGNGIKGVINPEFFRFTLLPGGPVNDKQKLDGGNFIYLRNGIAVGFDPGNGSMV